ncbi:hypothetical protein PPSC2_20985 [Paenibacillus polymyxa SC2]|uniref:Uncharacterized protein n=1 Tax=Paenibacillus polymyxa (strain SC2) TaxID=886882 RepID=A0A0D5ZCJ8_PAEPS|nr:hypothetical protein PPSC2_20985 [Paenibacillus polymyxa SC2]
MGSIDQSSQSRIDQRYTRPFLGRAIVKTQHEADDNDNKPMKNASKIASHLTQLILIININCVNIILFTSEQNII